ncbi:MAG: hypothetical protein U5R48_07895 [Gammaproteobacteria bacterium]|nr:hypothetical protein [Gammaproteobacteria bacterium]
MTASSPSAGRVDDLIEQARASRYSPASCHEARGRCCRPHAGARAGGRPCTGNPGPRDRNSLERSQRRDPASLDGRGRGDLLRPGALRDAHPAGLCYPGRGRSATCRRGGMRPPRWHPPCGQHCRKSA